MELITRVRRSSSGTDSYGQPVYTTASSEVGAIVSARVSGTNFDADQIVVTDKFIIRTKTYELDGEAFDWRDGLGSWSPGTVVNLQREVDRG